MKHKTLYTWLGIIGILAGFGFICPAVAQMQTTGSLPSAGVGLLFLGISLFLTGAVVVHGAFKKNGRIS